MSFSRGLDLESLACGPVATRFMANVDVLGDCWTWLGGMGSSGYGSFSVAGSSRGAHVVSHAMFIGPVPTGQVVCHRCDNPPCVNPAHLFVGSVADNNRDAWAKGRARWPQKRSWRRTPPPVLMPLEPTGPTGRDRVLQALLVSPDGLMRGQIAKRVSLTPKHTSDLLRDLLAEGAVVRDATFMVWRLAS